MPQLTIKTTKNKEVVDITEEVNELVKGRPDGLVNLFVTHTTCALATADLDEGGTDLDYLDAFEKMVPKLNFRHPHDPSHMPDHILSSTIGTSLTVPIRSGQLALGTWQRLVLFEFSGPRPRTIIVSFI